MIGQMVKGAGGALRPSILALVIAALLAGMLSVAADSASALVIFDGNNDHDRNNGFEFNGLNFDDQELESGDIDTETDISIEGNNNNQCVGLSQFGQTGNFANQQGTTQNDIGEFEQEFEGPEFEFAPENETACEQDVQQAAAASSSWW
jgi:hypothetical protein